MPLTAPGLSAAIKTAVDTNFPIAGDPAAVAYRQDFCDTLATAIVTYLVSNSVIIHPLGPGTLT